MARKFGVEVEIGGTMQATLHHLQAAGLTNTTSQFGYVGHSMTEWVVKTDASVPGGVEVVSPPLDFDDPEQRGQVDRLFPALQAADCFTLPQGGIHVHIDASDLTPEQVAAVARCFVKFEDLIYRIASSGWATLRPGGMERWARPMTDQQITGMTRVKNDRQLRRAWYGAGEGATAGHGHGSRYCGINIHSWFYRGTIEFRVFNTSLNAERVQAYIALCMALVQDARNGKRRSVNKAYRLGGMAAGTTDPKNAYHRLQQVVRYEAGMSMVDYKRLNKVWKDSRPQIPATTGGW